MDGFSGQTRSGQNRTRCLRRSTAGAGSGAGSRCPAAGNLGSIPEVLQPERVGRSHSAPTPTQSLPSLPWSGLHALAVAGARKTADWSFGGADGALRMERNTYSFSPRARSTSATVKRSRNRFPQRPIAADEESIPRLAIGTYLAARTQASLRLFGCQWIRGTLEMSGRSRRSLAPSSISPRFLRR